MDALKKAEQAKRKAERDSASAEIASPAPDDSHAAAHGEPGPAATFENLELVDDTRIELEPPASPPPLILDDMTPAAIVEPATPGHVDAAQQRESVQNLFDSKQGDAPSRKTFAIVVGLATLIALAAIGAYFWYQLQPKSGLQVRTPNMNASGSPGLSAPAPLPLPPAPGVNTSAPPSQQEKADLRMRPDATETEDEEEYATRPAPRSVPPPQKVFRVTAPASLTNQPLDRAYAALTHGDDAAAKVGYQKVLASDPKNADALAGLAVIAQRSGDNAQAADYYLQILDADPRNAAALAGLINLQSRLDVQEAETRVKQALSTQPDSPALNFTLGNIYARGKRWHDAQQAYFKAVGGDPGNPDYLFNLAVSLDQIRQPKLATTYYAQALAAADNRPVSFDRARLGERLQQLQQP